MDYSQQLKDSRWLDLRSAIMQRDWNMCQKCMSGKNLQVHHKQYIEGRMAWEYRHEYLITLCDKCHEEEHLQRDISEFIGPPDPYIESIGFIKESIAALKALTK